MRLAILIILALFGIQQVSSAQDGWVWTDLTDMPEAVSNNAVTSAYCGDSLCIYSFCGIDESKTPAGIHLKSWRYNTISQLWTPLEDVPDFQGKIAASATTVNNKIYLIGGYYVNEDFSESSSDDVHIFDPETNTWLEDGALIPVPIDDHVHALWRDSLIFIVTGWSGSQNVRDVQIYDPIENLWTASNDLPITNSYPVFGASGNIVNDTLFYLGGVNNSFNTMSRMRRGIIQDNDPTNIVWDIVGESPVGDSYRSACAVYENRLYFIGGSDDGYNFDGISYDSGLGVEAQNRIVAYYSQWEFWEDQEAPYHLMDMRGIAKVSENSWVICGGMMEDQEVSNRTFLLELDPSAHLETLDTDTKAKIHYNPIDQSINYSSLDLNSNIVIYDSTGSLIESRRLTSGDGTLPFTNYPKGIYFVHFPDHQSSHIDTFRFINH